jgi:hypothetical protein
MPIGKQTTRGGYSPNRMENELLVGNIPQTEWTTRGDYSPSRMENRPLVGTIPQVEWKTDHSCRLFPKRNGKRIARGDYSPCRLENRSLVGAIPQAEWKADHLATSFRIKHTDNERVSSFWESLCVRYRTISPLHWYWLSYSWVWNLRLALSVSSTSTYCGIDVLRSSIQFKQKKIYFVR